MESTVLEIKHEISLDQYFDQEFVAECKHEFTDGQVQPMAWASVMHGRLSVNLMVKMAVLLQQKESSCQLYNSDQLLFVADYNAIYYPDLMLVCGNPEYYKHKSTGRLAITNPTVIVEILSNSTQFMDKITKWACYKTIPSLKEYILINQYQYCIEKYERKGENEWLLTEKNKIEDTILIHNLQIMLQDVYKNTQNLPIE